MTHPGLRDMAMDLSESEELFRALARSGFVVAWTAGPDGAFLSPQPSWEAFTGQTWEVHDGHGWMTAIPESERAGLITALREGTSVTIRTGLWRSAESRHIPVAMTWSAQARPREPMQWHGYAVSIPASQIGLEQRLLACEHEFEEFAAIASHDLREPIRGIANFATFVIEDYGPTLEGAGRDKLRTIIRLADRLNAQLDAIMEYCSLQSSVLRPRRTDLNDAVRCAVLALGCSSDSVAVARPLPEAFCDPLLITTVLTKLIHNGLKFNQSAAPRIQIDGVTDVAGTTVTIRDNGIGVSPTQAGRLFHMFKRLNPRERYEGTGAGLAVSRRIIELHGGRIWVNSGDGRGAEFSFSLPHAAVRGADAGVDPVHHAH